MHLFLLAFFPIAFARHLIPLSGFPPRTRSTIQAFSRPHFLSFEISGRTYFANDEPQGDVVLMVLETTLGPFRYRTSYHSAISASRTGEIRGSISVGPTGDLVRAVGSIDFLFNQGFLRLGYDEEEFLQDACVPESVLAVPTRTVWSDRRPFASTTRALLSMSGQGDRIETLVFFSGGTAARWSTTTSVLTLPREFMNTLLGQIPVAIRLPSEEVNIFFTNCSFTRQSLPNILVTFLQGDEPTGTLGLSPDDYIESIEDDVCVLKVRETFGLTSETDIRINPIGLEGINFRVTERQFIFCDSL
jgi:hypothetical protein